jgi:light-regulated signal transduction histidine kinase (bacteriophytochrome)
MSPAPRHATADLDACEKEQLPFSGQIQDVGALIATPPLSAEISHISTNLDHWFEVPEEPGTLTLADLFQDDCSYFAHRRRRIFEDRHFVIRGVMTNRGIEGDLLVSENDAHTLYEFEARPVERPAPEPVTAPPVTVDTRVLPEAIAVETALQRIHSITGYPKIMLYRFLDDGAGEVAAELSDNQLDNYQGLRFPSSDIPRIARSLYIDNPFRLIFDTRDPAAKVRSLTGDERPLDLSLSTLRSVSPVHIEYLGNMGVRSSASFPVRVMGKLWGLVAMHAPEPTPITVESRLQVTQLVEQELSRRLMDVHIRENHRRFNASVELLEHSAAAINELLRAPAALPAAPQVLAELVACDALFLIVDGNLLTPAGDFSAQEITCLRDLGRQQALRSQFLTQSVHSFMDQNEDFRRRASGLLYATLGASRTHKSLEILWIRHEQAGSVTWAGKPEKRSEVVDGEERISPRKSFAAWHGITQGLSSPWSSGDQLVASKLLVRIIALQRGEPDRSDPPE